MALRIAPVALLISAAAAGHELPGPASGSTDLRYATIEIDMSPPAPLIGESALLRAQLKLKPGLEWREPKLVPWSARVVAPEGWSVDPEQPAFRPAGPTGAMREFETTLTRGERSLRAMVVIELEYALGGTSGETYDKLLIEQSRITVSIPNAGVTTEEATELVPLLDLEFAGTSEAETTDSEQGGASPIMPALFFALATILVLVGIAISMRHSRRAV